MLATSKLLKATSSSGRSRSPAAFDAVDLQATAVLQCSVALFEDQRLHKQDGTPCRRAWVSRPVCQAATWLACVRSREVKLNLVHHNTLLIRAGEDWKPLLCSAMADGLLPGAGKKLARQALRALCGGHSAYRDAKVSFRLRLQLQVPIVRYQLRLRRCSCSGHHGTHPLPVRHPCKEGCSCLNSSSVHMTVKGRKPCVRTAAARRDRGHAERQPIGARQAVLCCGAKHVQRGVSEHEPAARLLDALRQLQRTAADRPPCWALLCTEAANALPRLVHGALTWCTPARLPALQLVATALGAKGHSKGYV